MDALHEITMSCVQIVGAKVGNLFEQNPALLQ